MRQCEQRTLHRVGANTAFHTVLHLEAQIRKPGPPRFLAGVPLAQNIFILRIKKNMEWKIRIRIKCNVL